jgi:hypothetical protein
MELQFLSNYGRKGLREVELNGGQGEVCRDLDYKTRVVQGGRECKQGHKNNQCLRFHIQSISYINEG